MSADAGQQDELPPEGLALVLMFLAGYLLANPLPADLWYAQWGFVAAGVLAGAYLSVKTWELVNSEGIVTAIELTLGGRSKGGNSTNTQSKVPPAPEAVRNGLYFERADRKCEWCEAEIENFEVHHIKPRADGGGNERSNLVVLCPNCHSKADRGGISKSQLQYRVRDQMGEA